MRLSHKTFHYNAYFTTTLSIAICGIVNSIYLAITHYRNNTDLTFSSFCAISKSINCDTVAQSAWSVAFGLPVALWGLFGYTFFLTLLFPVRKYNQTKFPLWSLLIFLGGIYSLVSLFLGYISALKIHSYCILCLGSYAINFFLFYMSWITRKRFISNPFSTDIRLSFLYLAKCKQFCTAAATVLLLCIITVIFLPQYWKFDPSPHAINISKGITNSGQPWIGAPIPILTIEEFSDYQCFQCAKTHLMLRRLVEKHPDTVRLVHRHYPMDSDFNPTVVPDPFHIGSGKMALLAIYAMTQNKFWQMNDALFQLARSRQSFNTRFLSEKTGIPSKELVAALSHPDIQKQLNHDILKGMKLRITGTPSFVIDGQVYQGFIPPDILKKITQ